MTGRLMIAASVLMLSSPAHANPADAFGLGARGAALGGAQVAATDDTAANYYNPAALASFDEMRIDIGYRAAVPVLEIGGLDVGVDMSRGFQIGLSAPGQIGPVKLALGTTVFLPDEQLTRVRSLPGDQPRFVLYDNRPQRLLFSANVAFAIGERLFVGGGVSFMSNTLGSVDLTGRLGFPDADDSEFALAIDVDLKTIRYPQAGALYRANDWLTVGASFRGEFSLVLDQTVSLVGDVGAEGADPVVENGFLELRSLGRDLFQPMQLTAGFAAKLGAVLLSFDASLHRWSRFKNPASQIDFDLDVGDFNDLVDIPPPPPIPEPNFRDILIPRIGAEFRAHQTERIALDVRGGYAYEPTPAPEQVGVTNLIDNDKHTLSAGAGLSIARPLSVLARPLILDAFVALTLLESRSHRKLSAVDPVGDYRAGGRVWQFGLTSRWQF